MVSQCLCVCKISLKNWDIFYLDFDELLITGYFQTKLKLQCLQILPIILIKKVHGTNLFPCILVNDVTRGSVLFLCQKEHCK